MERQRAEDEEKKRKESQERQQMTEDRAANNIRMARERLKERPEAALPAINELIMGIPGAAQGPLGKVKQSLMTAMTTGNGALQPGMREQLLAQADQQLRALDDSFVSRGVLKPETVEKPEEYTLGKGAKRFRDGKMISENPDPQGDTGSRANYQSGSTSMFQDEDGNNYVVMPRFDPNQGDVQPIVSPIGGAPDQPIGRLTPINQSTGETAQQSSSRKTNERARELALNAGKEAFERLTPIAEGIASYDDVINLIDEGAESGPIMSRLPSFRTASVKLDHIQNLLGLNVIQNTTFGALSEKELQMALDTGLPTRLPPAELRQWAIDKMDAQKKLYNYIQDTAGFLLREDTTIEDWLNQQKERQSTQDEFVVEY